VSNKDSEGEFWYAKSAGGYAVKTEYLSKCSDEGGRQDLRMSLEIKDLYKGECLTWERNAATVKACSGEKSQQWIWDSGILRPVSDLTECAVMISGTCEPMEWIRKDDNPLKIFTIRQTSTNSVLTVPRSGSDPPGPAVVCEFPCPGVQHFFVPTNYPPALAATIGPFYSDPEATETPELAPSIFQKLTAATQSDCEEQCLDKAPGDCKAAVFKADTSQCHILTAAGDNLNVSPALPSSVLLLPSFKLPYRVVVEDIVCVQESSTLWASSDTKAVSECYAICDGLPQCVAFSRTASGFCSLLSKRPVVPTDEECELTGGKPDPEGPPEYFIHVTRFEAVPHPLGYPEKDVATVHELSFDQCTSLCDILPLCGIVDHNANMQTCIINTRERSKPLKLQSDSDSSDRGQCLVQGKFDASKRLAEVELGPCDNPHALDVVFQYKNNADSLYLDSDRRSCVSAGGDKF
jgi:hypothetical protein